MRLCLRIEFALEVNPLLEFYIPLYDTILGGDVVNLGLVKFTGDGFCLECIGEYARELLLIFL